MLMQTLKDLKVWTAFLTLVGATVSKTYLLSSLMSGSMSATCLISKSAGVS